MLGGLAKWLRFLGFDTFYLRRGPGRPLPGRTLLTRRSDRPHQPGLGGWPRVVRLSADRTQDQLAAVIRALDLTREDLRPMTRCSVCNQGLCQADPEEVRGRVPEYVQGAYTRFSFCPGCGRIYWPGTHHGRMLAVIEELFK